MCAKAWSPRCQPTKLSGPLRFAHRCAGLIAKRRAKHVERPDRLARAVDRLGPSWVKLGQFLATRPDVVGVEIARDLSGLQDRMSTFPESLARAEIEASIGRPMAELFSRFDPPRRRRLHRPGASGRDHR